MKWVAILAMAVAMVSQASLGADPGVSTPPTTVGAEGKASTPPDAVTVAKQLCQRGCPEEAAKVLEAAVAGDPLDVAALELLVRTRQELAESLSAGGNLSAAGDQLHRALAAARACQDCALSDGTTDMGLLDKIRALRQSSQAAVERHVRLVVRQARGSYYEGKGIIDDDEEKFIEALVLLDGVKGLLEDVPLELRQSFAEVWWKCYLELGSADIAQYKARTYCANGTQQ